MDTLDDPLPPNGFFPVSLNVVGRRCVVIGPPDDREAVEKVHALREVDADVVWIDDPAALRDEDVIDAFFVISTPQDAALSGRLRALADVHRFMLCTIDQPRFGFVAMQAIVKAGPVRLGISTGGVAPRVGKNLKAALERVMDGKFVRFIECLATQKRRNRARIADGGTRRAAMIAAADGFDVEMHVTYPEWFEAEWQGLRPQVDAPVPAAVDRA
jgi:uroporphyrin-III C-methyltransferase/precorrin-2 dehydrogenase/sirohydrochlorin ferrochelatase/precorrin-2 dehydrogenase/sirohydrochlorin ferrochelatase